MATCPDCGEAMLTELPHRHALDCDGKPFCPSGYAQRYHAIGQCACNDPGHIDWYPANDTVERFVYDLGGWPTPQVERRRMERLRALIAKAVAAEKARIREGIEGVRASCSIIEVDEDVIFNSILRIIDREDEDARREENEWWHAIK